MPDSLIQPEPVPSTGPLTVGRVYRRKDLHKRYGGNQSSGIVPSIREPVVILFHTEEKAHQYYQDGYDPKEGVYWYSGAGSKGDMVWSAANRTIRDHDSTSRDLILFERAQRKDGLWRLYGIMKCVGFEVQTRPDKSGKIRKAIVFALMPASELVPPPQPGRTQVATETKDKKAIRDSALRAQNVPRERRTSTREVYDRAEKIREWVLHRAAGVCEACGVVAPFMTAIGRPYLEAHHIARLADEGIERIDRIAGICPNCHRRCHYGSDAAEYNSRLLATVQEKESTL